MLKQEKLVDNTFYANFYFLHTADSVKSVMVNQVEQYPGDYVRVISSGLNYFDNARRDSYDDVWRHVMLNETFFVN